VRVSGRLVGLWGIFWRPLRIDHNKIGEVILALMKLSNVMLDFPGQGEDGVWLPVVGKHSYMPSVRVRAEYEGATPGDEPLPLKAQKAATSALRKHLTAVAAGAGYHRPGRT
jgi:hypothetical protein